ncbi:major capsid protein [Dipodfec virus RodF1_80]|uniref:Major capsid protein n=1 Tax=Dipodfec virus RodF1_80 TaxID=2929312 RepID=A0A976N2Y3_9VIRU|nr:major capsid protein [Dipodfec virus RodF1_80]
MANIFNSIRTNKPKKTIFQLDHENLLSGEIGWLMPVQIHPTLPFEKWSGKTEVFIRLAPLMYPIYARVNSYIHHFFMPERLLWQGWQEFITGGKDGNSDIVYPRIGVTGALIREIPECFAPSSLYDYLGFPAFSKEDLNFIENDDTHVLFDLDILPFLAYQKIWQNYYADQTLTDFKLDDDYLIPDNFGYVKGLQFMSTTPMPGTEFMSIIDFLKYIMTLRNRAWEKDYFTSALPTPQRGDDVNLPLVGNASVNFDSATVDASNMLTPPLKIVDEDGHNVSNLGAFTTDSQGFVETNNRKYVGFSPTGDRGKLPITGQGTVDLSDARMVSINELRRGFSVQRFKEVLARTGYRYRDYIYGIFGGLSSDSRLQRPEYLGGGKAPIVIGEILQTSQTTESSPLGEMAGKGVGAASDNGFKYRTEEHGYIISIMSVIPRSSYSQGLNRLFTKFDKTDYGNPLFAHLGEQEVKNSELYLSYHTLGGNFQNLEKNDKTFGYQSRYAEYKYCPNTIHGDFRTSLNRWHMSRQFDTNPGLNHYFVTVNPKEVNRVFAVETDVNHLWIQVYNKVRALRPLPKYGTPRL